MTILIIVNQKDSAKIKDEISRLDENVFVIGTCSSVAESTHWLQINPHPDLIIMDIQLSDGLSYCIFKSSTIVCPVIFCYSVSDNIPPKAFAYNGIDYLPKPINYPRLKKAIHKYKNLQRHFIKNHSPFMDYLNKNEKNNLRIVVKKALGYHTVLVNDIVYFTTNNKLVFLIDKEGRKYLTKENNLSELEEKLINTHIFFRANRKYMINVNYLKQFNIIDNNKIRLDMLWPAEDEIIVSEEKSPYFRKWIQNI
jgi:DNA-binding LytR/AlgR family response regulator